MLCDSLILKYWNKMIRNCYLIFRITIIAQWLVHKLNSFEHCILFIITKIYEYSLNTINNSNNNNDNKELWDKFFTKLKKTFIFEQEQKKFYKQQYFTKQKCHAWLGTNLDNFLKQKNYCKF